MAHSSLFRHAKLKKLAKILNVGLPQAVGHLDFLWNYVADCRYDGDLTGMQPEDIEMAAEWDGKKGVFINAAVLAGFIDEHLDCRRIHDWQDWMPDYVRKRLQRRNDKTLRSKTADNGGQRLPMDAARRTTADHVGLSRVGLGEESAPPTPSPGDNGHETSSLAKRRVPRGTVPITTSQVAKDAQDARSEAARLFGGPEGVASSLPSADDEDQAITGPLDPMYQAMSDITGRSPGNISGRDRIKVERLLEDGFSKARLIEIMGETKRRGGGLTEAVLQAWEEIKQRGHAAARRPAKGDSAKVAAPPGKYDHLRSKGAQP